MKKHLTVRFMVAPICAMTLGLLSCANQLEDHEMVNIPVPSDEATAPIKDAVFHKGTESWIRPQKDPYTLENFQRAYDNLLLGKSAQVLTRSQSNEFSGAEQLSATHYSLKIFPKNEQEQWKIELMEDVKVSYTPFDYVQLPEAEAEKLTALTRSDAPMYPEVGHYTVTYEDMESTDGNVETVTYTMPILYTVWTCDKPLPEDMDYEIDYEIYLPPYNAAQTRNSMLSANAMQILENEAISLALGISANAITRADPVRTLTGRIYYYDKFLKANVPQANLKQRFQLGSNISETYTQSNGYFSITAPISTAASYIHVFQHPKWKITKESSTDPHTVSWGTVNAWWSSTNEISMQPTSSVPAYGISPAVNYFYNGFHSIPAWSYSSGIRIVAM